MLMLIMTIMFFAVFGRLLFFAIKVGWGIFKIATYLIFLPAIVLLMIFGGLFYLAIPILIIAGIASLAQKTY